MGQDFSAVHEFRAAGAVTYRPDAKAGRAWSPAEMRETYAGAAQRLDCVATYSNIRPFQVTTDVQIPK